jgi:hypothetical protein
MFPENPQEEGQGFIERLEQPFLYEGETLPQGA